MKGNIFIKGDILCLFRPFFNSLAPFLEVLLRHMRQTLVKIPADLHKVALCLNHVLTPLCFQGGDLASSQLHPFSELNSY